jgi:hypothetical protein
MLSHPKNPEDHRMSLAAVQALHGIPATQANGHRFSSEVSDARDSNVTVAMFEIQETKKKSTSYDWAWRILCFFLILSLGFASWKIYTRPSKPAAALAPLPAPMARVELSKALKGERKTEVAKWDISRTKIMASTWEDQVDRILANFKTRYPQRHAALPFDIKEHYRWMVKHYPSRKEMGNEFELYSMMYYDWSNHEEVDPFLRLLDGAEITKRFTLFKDDKDFSYSMENVEKGVKRKPFSGSKVETRDVPRDIIDGFKAQDETTVAAKEIFDRWEGRDSVGDRLCVEDCAMRIGLLAEGGGSYWAVMEEGHVVHRQCEIIQRANSALLDALVRNDAFRNYLAWKGLRKNSSKGWGTLFYNYANSKPYEMLFFVNDKSISFGGKETADGDAFYSNRNSWNRLTPYESGRTSPSNSTPSPKLADSLTIGRRKNWPRVEFEESFTHRAKLSKCQLTFAIIALVLLAGVLSFVLVPCKKRNRV